MHKHKYKLVRVHHFSSNVFYKFKCSSCDFVYIIFKNLFWKGQAPQRSFEDILVYDDFQMKFRPIMFKPPYFNGEIKDVSYFQWGDGKGLTRWVRRGR